MITRKELIRKYLDFFKEKGHKVIPSASLIPSNDPTVLFTTAGMHPLTPYLLGQRHPLGKRIVSVQKCIRTTDIDSVGDGSHNTFFEMLGNWSLGDYWKKEAIGMSFEFLTKILKVKKDALSVTCFKGDADAEKDEESGDIWKSLGIRNIKFLGKGDNWWGPAGKTGPCGPDTEMFVNGFEIWNDVFMQYNKKENGRFEPLKQKNVDTGMGVERTLVILNGLKDIYETDAWKPIIKRIEEISDKGYKGNEKAMRIIADHIKASVFILADGIMPGNTGQGYVLRRLIRRAVKYGRVNLKLEQKSGFFIDNIAESVFEVYPDYVELQRMKKEVLKMLLEEENKFNKTLVNGIKEFNSLSEGKKTLSGKDAFLLYQSYGFPIELTEELAKERKIRIDIKPFREELAKHQELSRTASSGVFKSGLADNSEKTVRLHTATHLLNEALRRILGPEVKQRGSNITSERLRFDFSFSRKLTEKEIKEVEGLVNKKISEKLGVKREEIPLKKAMVSGAQSEFGAKYPDSVSVYTVLDSKEEKGWFSKEICTGPHVKNTEEIGKFRIIKEESIAAGIRRIKAVVED